MLLLFGALGLVGIGLMVLFVASLERVAGDRLVVEMRTWSEDLPIAVATADPGRAA